MPNPNSPARSRRVHGHDVRHPPGTRHTALAARGGYAGLPNWPETPPAACHTYWEGCPVNMQCSYPTVMSGQAGVLNFYGCRIKKDIGGGAGPHQGPGDFTSGTSDQGYQRPGPGSKLRRRPARGSRKRASFRRGSRSFLRRS